MHDVTGEDVRALVIERERLHDDMSRVPVRIPVGPNCLRSIVPFAIRGPLPEDAIQYDRFC